jgi:nucleoside-specific outer membrane channel protein Tsx
MPNCVISDVQVDWTLKVVLNFYKKYEGENYWDWSYCFSRKDISLHKDLPGVLSFSTDCVFPSGFMG